MSEKDASPPPSILVTVDPEIPVPPMHYGGIERVVDGLVGELARRGVRVVLAAHPESRAEATLQAWPAGESRGTRAFLRNLCHVGETLQRDGPFDVVHSFGRLGYVLPHLLARGVPVIQSYQRHITPRSFRIGRRLGGRRLAFTACGSPCWPRGVAADDRAIVVPNFAPAEKLGWTAEVAPDAPLVFLGRLERIKGPDLAIEVARRAGRRIVVAGTYAEAGEEGTFFRDVVRPFLGGEGVEYVGPVDDDAKGRLLSSAAALLMPIRWEEPFGIVMAEALACGTPVIGLRRGAVPEVVRDGTTGFVCGTVDEMVAAVGRLPEIDRKVCRAEAERRFSPSVVTDAYLRVYARVASAEAAERFLSALREPVTRTTEGAVS